MIMSKNYITKIILLVWICFISTKLNAQEKAANAFYFASEIVADSKGNLFVVGKGNRIIKITPDGNTWHFAGHPKGYSQEKDGNGANAMFTETRGITIDEDDNLFITDYNTIRKVTPAGTVSRYCGNLAKRIS